jgi:signal recognition particle GTPase
MKKTIKNILKEELSRADKNEIKKLARSEFEDMLKTSDIKSKIEKIVIDQLKKDKPTQKEVAEITQKVLVQFYKTMWTRRSFWSNKLDNI